MEYAGENRGEDAIARWSKVDIDHGELLSLVTKEQLRNRRFIIFLDELQLITKTAFIDQAPANRILI
jgi:hypothetical protein